MLYFRKVLLAFSMFFLTACAAALVPYTSDPLKKLGWANELFGNQQRPIPAESLIRQAITICSKSNDFSCLGLANLTYGFFFRSPSIRKNRDFYEKHGFLDETATYENRLTKSKEYFESAISYYAKDNDFGALTNAYLNLGFSFSLLNEHDKECDAYEKSLEFNRKTIEKNPDLPIALPEGFSSYREYVQVHQKRAGCI